MVRPASFGFNAETAQDNAFMNSGNELGDDINSKAQKEFDEAVNLLRKKGITVNVFEDSKTPIKPDAVFPNNWFSCHDDGRIVLYPMMAKSRRTERREDVVNFLKDKKKVSQVLNLSDYESKGQILEGTGSIVFDYVNRKAYACRSSRTDPELLTLLCQNLEFESIVFTSVDVNGIPFYHTNVMMWIGADVVAICDESIKDVKEHELVMSNLKASGREIVRLSFDEIEGFCGNCLELSRHTNEKPLLAISSRALGRLSEKNRSTLSRFLDFAECKVDTIEHVGGGGIRCMLAGIHLPNK